MIPSPQTRAWKSAFEDTAFRIEMVAMVAAFFFGLSFFSYFLGFIELRSGVILQDPLLSKFPPLQLTWLTFSVIYSSLIIAIFAMRRNPRALITAIQAYILMSFFRIIAMSCLPLDPPPQMIFLEDPFVKWLTIGKTPVKDLFFSGHTSTMFLLYLTAEQPRIKKILLLSTFTIATCVLLQHVHYTIDVFAAPFFAYGSYRSVLFLRRFFSKSGKTAIENASSSKND
jgi:hypothetical protein